MDIDISILDSFPSITKLIKNDNLILEINNIKYNLKKIIDHNKLIKLSKIKNKIIFKIYINKKDLFGINIFKIEKLKESFTLDGKSFILWIEFKKENNNDNYNLLFYNSIKLKTKFIPNIPIQINMHNNKEKNSNKKDNNNINIKNKKLRNNINENLYNTENTNFCCLSSSNFYKKKYEDVYLNNKNEGNKNDIKNKNQRLKNNKQEKMKYKLSSNHNINNIISSKNISNNLNKQKIKKSNQKKISNKTSNIINPEDNFILTENNDNLKNLNINKSVPKVNNNLYDKNKDIKIIYKKNKNKNPSKINYIKREVNIIKKSKSINYYKIIDEDINNSNNKKKNNFHKNMNLSNSYNKNILKNKDFNISGKIREKQLNIKQNNNLNIKPFNSTLNKNSKKDNINSYNGKNNKVNNLYNLSKPILETNSIKNNLNKRFEQEKLRNSSAYENKYKISFKKSYDTVKRSAKSNLSELIALEEINKNYLEDNIESHENSQLINNISITNNTINDDITIYNNIENIEDIYKDNYLLNNIYYYENETIDEFNSLKNNFELLYSKTFINNIKKDLIILEFKLALEKIFSLFTCYKKDVEYLYFKNLNLRNEIKNLETKIKYIRKKLYKLNGKKEDLKSKKKRLKFIKESEFYFIEDIKIQKLIQKNILENLIKIRISQKQKFISIFKEIVKKRSKLLNLKNKENKINKNNNINDNINKNSNNMNNFIKNDLERLTFNKAYKIYENHKKTKNINKLNINNKTKTSKNIKDKMYNTNNLTENTSSEIKFNKFFNQTKSFSKGFFNKNIVKSNDSLANGNYISSYKSK